jgi:hypothetical protein
MPHTSKKKVGERGVQIRKKFEVIVLVTIKPFLGTEGQNFGGVSQSFVAS